MAYSYEQGIIDGDKTQEKVFENNPTWVDLNKKVKRNYKGADFWLPKEKRGNIFYGPKLELKGRNCDKVDPYKNQMEDSVILVVEFDGDGVYHLWYMKDFIEQAHIPIDEVYVLDWIYFAKNYSKSIYKVLFIFSP